MNQQLKSLQAEAQEKFAAATSLAELNDSKVAYLGKKGSLTAIMKEMGKMSQEERPRFGQMVNEVRDILEKSFAEYSNKLSADEMNARLIANGDKILGHNTDGIWYQGPVYHGEGEGNDLGQWRNDYVDCRFRAKSSGAYEFIENGSF